MKDQPFWGIPISGPDGRSGEDVVEILENHCAGLVWVCIVYKQIHGIWYMVHGMDGWRRYCVVDLLVLNVGNGGEWGLLGLSFIMIMEKDGVWMWGGMIVDECG